MIYFIIQTLIQAYNERKENWKNDLITIPSVTKNNQFFYLRNNGKHN
jgi:hypothetical protein